MDVQNAAEDNRLSFKKILGLIGILYDRIGILLLLLVMVVALSTVTPHFLTKVNIINLVRQTSFIAIIAIGSTIVMITMGIDLSPGSLVGITSVIVASYAHPNQMPLVGALAIGLLVGIVAGLINGTLISYLGLAPFIVTLGMYTAARGAAMVYTNGIPITNFSSNFLFIGAGDIFGIPVPIIILLVVAVIFHFMLTRTRFGRHIYAIGGNEHAAVISGINVKRVKVLVYVLAGVLASVSGIALTARIASGQPSLGLGYELDAITAAVVGGTSLTGGKGSVFGTISGALVIGVINNGMDLLNCNVFWQQVIKGIIIVLAVLIDQLQKRRTA
ncbi:Ribose ABC transport system, permease protein RbsC [Desulfosporosinus sp. I2]|nr:Ribose ABC transport system, permease protein RbsC [Desulfosporosinus sp. I2]